MGAISAQFVNGSLEKNIPLMLFITSACMFLGGVCAWLLPHDSTGTSMSHVNSSIDFNGNKVDNEIDKNAIKSLKYETVSSVENVL